MKLEKELTANFFLKFNQTVNYRCPICGGNQLGVTTECMDEIENMFRNNPDMTSDDLQKLNPVITVDCITCGHIDQFSSMWIQTAIRQSEQ